MPYETWANLTALLRHKGRDYPGFNMWMLLLTLRHLRCVFLDMFFACFIIFEQVKVRNGTEGAVQPDGLMASWQTAARPLSNICSLSLSAMMSPYRYTNSLYKHLQHDPQADHTAEDELFQASTLNGSRTFNRSESSVGSWQLLRLDVWMSSWTYTRLRLQFICT